MNAEQVPTADILQLPVRRRAPATPTRFKIQPFTNPRTGTDSWRVSGSKRDGTRVRENFADQESANCRQIELETEFLRGHTETTIRATKLTAEQCQLAEVAFIKLGDDWQRILDAVDWWKEHGKDRMVADSPRVDDAVAKYLEWLEASPLRDATKRHWKIRMNVFRNSIKNLRVSEITPEHIDEFLATRKTTPGGRDTDRRAVSRFFSWSKERQRRWCKTNPCREVKVEQAERKPPEVLSVDQCRRLLKAAGAHKGGILAPYVSVCLFGGLRPFEAARLTWEQVNLADGEIRLEANQTKTKRSRVIKIDDTLKRWLKAHKGKPFFPANWRKEFDALRETAKITNWPSDVMRHTACSMFFRQTESYGRTAEQFGNSEKIIKDHYQGRVTSDDAKKFYSITPR